MDYYFSHIAAYFWNKVKTDSLCEADKQAWAHISAQYERMSRCSDPYAFVR